MSTIRLQTNQHQLIANLRHAFTPYSMLGELLQNARRAQASHIQVVADGSALIVNDDGCGITDLQTLIFIAESGWDTALKERENAFGLGVLSTLYFAERLSVHSCGHAFQAATATIIRGDAIEVYPTRPHIGTEVRLDGVQSPVPALTLQEWVQGQLERLCKAFPVQVSLNGSDIPRPLADTNLPWRQTPVGRILLDLGGHPTQWQCFLQGLPIGRIPALSKHQIVLLRDDMIARLPDRQHLLNEDTDHPRIQAAINDAYRQALIEVKERLAGSEFVELYAETCLSSSNADLLNDVPFVPRAWFRNWQDTPAGYRRYWEHYALSGLSARVALEETGVWSIDSDEEDNLAVETYLEARQAFLLEEHRLDENHWLMHMLKTVSPDQIGVRHGAILHHDRSLPLAESIELFLVDVLFVRQEGEPGEYAVDALRHGDMLYLTRNAGNVTELVSDYVFDDRYDENSEDEDARTLATFIAVGCSQDPAHIVKVLLPYALRYSAQPKLAGAIVRLIFDTDGKLQEVATD
ncbi:ATP-binding protein [Pseudomonas aeruginosa]|uniref:ATP-binding protein n=1 Tax=Pseudomonas aeruginosa TaxID=287 RepID=UPI00071B20FB|nr:ATP-binding protein [Pseudomonas aeruginosa]KSQ24934.1 ATP-binding protein [Pseudomonas aeruginosa]MCO1686894.1 ATP-binding protein [Pseudomonas aeruginosa]MCO1780309.1 ATP-binding protein [Pseudomonas aeruginosa]MCO1790205.1 ATP-binding protein [Pseudomonas aeruginosa]MCO1799511.1 ATP-binding protein [Pseudomonas aeruginosa]